MILAELTKEIEQFKATIGLQDFAIGVPQSDGAIDFKGKRLVDLASFDYLGLRTQKRLVRVLQEALAQRGLSATHPRLSGGGSFELERAEESVAKFLGLQRALAFTGRTQATFSVLSAILNESDVIFCNEDIQLPCSDAAYLCNAQVCVLDTHNMSEVGAALERFKFARRRVLIAEGLTMLTGAISPIPELAVLLRRHGAYLVLDESIALGAIGTRGAGSSEGVLFGEELLAIIADCSYGLSSPLAFIGGPEPLIDLLRSRSKTFSNEIAPSPAIAGLIPDVLKVIEESSAQRRMIAARAALLYRRLTAIGIQANGSGGPILSIDFSSPSLAHSYAEGLFHRGFHVDVVSSHKSLNSQSSVRMIVNSLVSDTQLDNLAQAIEDISKRK
jgi:glycine C-acetyltransferase